MPSRLGVAFRILNAESQSRKVAKSGDFLTSDGGSGPLTEKRDVPSSGSAQRHEPDSGNLLHGESAFVPPMDLQLLMENTHRND